MKRKWFSYLLTGALLAQSVPWVGMSVASAAEEGCSTAPADSVSMNPEPYALMNGSYTFQEWSPNACRLTYPANMVFQQSNLNDPGLSAEMSSVYDPGIDSSGDQLKPYSHTSRTRINGLGQNGVSFINTGRGRDVGAAVLALDTRGVTEPIQVGFTAGTINANSRVYAIRLQYRVGETTFTDVLKDGQPVEYMRSEIIGDSERRFDVTLPTEVLGQENVQLRWKYYHVSGTSGSRAELRLDDISVTTGVGPWPTPTLSPTPTSTPPIPSAPPLPLPTSTPTIGTGELTAERIGQYKSGAPLEQSGTEIVAFDPISKRGFSTNSDQKAIDIMNMSSFPNQDVERIKRVHINQLDLGGFEADGVTSVAVHPSGTYLAAAIPAKVKTDNGKVVFLNLDGKLLNSVDVGALPDMLTFTPNGRQVLVANEGEPNDDYTVDPEGSVSIIDVTKRVELINQSDVITAGFKDVPLHGEVRIFGPNATPEQDLEPEYIVVSADGRRAYVALQENNAIATLDLATKSFTGVYGLGAKDHSLQQNAMDVSDQDNGIHIKRWPVLGLYMPDGISIYEKDGKTYLLTANEGDAREYKGLKEAARVGSISNNIQLNADHYAGYSQEELDQLVAQGLFTNSQLGRLNVTTATYKDPVTGKYDRLYSFGARSFSIWDAESMTQVYDSGNEFEGIVAELYPNHFNANHNSNNRDTRSDDKGVEPEYVEIGTIGSETYAFVGLERMSGIMIYNITDPTNPKFVNYITSRDFSSSNDQGDLGPEGLKFIPAAKSPTGKPLLLAAHEVSGTIAVFELTSRVSSDPVPDADNFKLRVLHTNDTHAHLEKTSVSVNVAKRITAIEKNRNEQTLLLDAGDVFSGTLYFTQFNGLADLDFMNMARYDAMVPGNHEFDKGPAALRDFLNAAKFPMVSSNIDYSQSPELKSLYISDIGGKTRAPDHGKLYPAIVKEINGEQVGIFGLTTEDTVGLSSPGDHLVFQNYLTKAEETVRMLEAEGVNKIIALTHLGYDYDLTLARTVRGIDIVVGGHSHTRLDQAYVVRADEKDPAVVVQTGEHGEFLGKLDVVFDAEGNLKLQDLTSKLVPVKDYAEDPEAKKLLDHYKSQLDAIKNTKVGESSVDLLYEKMVNGSPYRLVRREETNLGNLITDGIVAATKEKIQALLPQQELASIKGYVAIQNGGGIRTGIPAGPITLEQVLTVMPFANSLVALKVTGEELIHALENGVIDAPAERGGFPHVSGMKYVFDSTNSKQTYNTATNEITFPGERIIEVQIYDEGTGKYVPIDRNAYYILGTNSFMADGGDFYYSLKKAKQAGRYYELYIPDYEIFTEHLKRVGKVEIGLEGRIKDLKGQGTATPSPTPTATTDPTESPSPTPTATTDPTESPSPTPTATTDPTESPSPTPSPTQSPSSTVPPSSNTNTPSPSPSPTPTTTPTPTSGVKEYQADELKELLTKLPAGSKELVLITSAGNKGETAVQLPLSFIVETAAANPDLVLVVSNSVSSLKLPLELLQQYPELKQLGQGASISISIERASSTIQSQVERVASQQNVQLLSDIFDYQVTVTVGSSTTEMNSFGNYFVERTITLNKQVGAAEATVVRIDPITGELMFVPAVFETTANGQTVVTFKRNGNSLYTVLGASKTFDDIQLSWARNSIERLAGKLLLKGISEQQFAPDQEVTRAEFAAMIVRGLGLSYSGGGSTGFSDVDTGAWYAGAIEAAVRAGLVSGYQDGSFRPNNPITRQEMAVMLSKAMGFVSGSGASPAASGTTAVQNFADRQLIADWAEAAVAQSVEASIINGYPDQTFGPTKRTTRAEAARMLEGLLEFLKFIN